MWVLTLISIAFIIYTFLEEKFGRAFPKGTTFNRQKYEEDIRNCVDPKLVTKRMRNGYYYTYFNFDEMNKNKK